MSDHFIARAAIASALAAIACFASPSALAAQGDCDRSCLANVLDEYLAAVFKHDPAAAPLSADHYATDNTAIVRNGEGFWRNTTGLGQVQRRYLDPVNEGAAFLGVLKRESRDVITSVRIRVEGGKISEAEWITATQGPGGQGEANPTGLVENPPPAGMLPPAERSSRFAMKSLTNDFYQAVKDHDGAWVPTDSDCIGVENGGRAGMSVMPRGHCLENMAGAADITKDVALRRFPIVDEEAGVVLASVIFVRHAGIARQDNLVHEYVLIRNDKIGGWWTSMHFLPLGSPVTTGWENRKGQIFH